MSRLLHVIRLAVALLARPDLWGTAVASGRRLVPDEWWRRGPLPPREYFAFRGPAVYGVRLTEIPAVDLIGYLEWCRTFPGPVR